MGTHFIDDRAEVLQSVYADEAGNSGDLITNLDGKLFHFDHGGTGKCLPTPPTKMSDGIRNHYHGVSGWIDVLAHSGKDIACERLRPHASVFTKTPVFMHRIEVGINEDVAFGVTAHLAKGFQEIEDFAGVKIVLRGRGSPHPQPKCEELNPLAIVIRTKPNGCGDLDTAVILAEDLLRDVIQ